MAAASICRARAARPVTNVVERRELIVTNHAAFAFNPHLIPWRKIPPVMFALISAAR
jgi:hypothetical protein